MSDFVTKQGDLQTSRKAREEARQALYAQRESFKLQQLKIRQRLTQERKPFLPDSDADQKLLLKQQEDLQELQEAFEEKHFDNLEEEEAFQQLDTHIKMVENLDDHYPILLMPLRVHTRFVNVKHLATNIPQEFIFDVSTVDELPEAPIGVRYDENKPDFNIHNLPTYFSLKAENHLSHSYYHHYSKNHFQNEQLYKGKNWLKVVPDRLELWVRIYPDDIFIHSHEPHLTPGERADGEAFWERWWAIHQANPNALKEEHAAEDLTEKPLFTEWTKLLRKYRHSRAAWIFKETMPKSYQENEPDYSKNPDFSKKPVRIKSDVWTQPILSWVMPEKFVVTLIQDGVTKHFEGNPIPHPLKLSPEPSKEASLDEIKWAADFEEAEKIGMAIRIPIKANRFKVTKPFQKIIVVGIKNSLNPKQSKEALEGLMENHRFKGTGMAILPQGTPTNNFEKVRSGYTEHGLPSEEVFKLETGSALFGKEAQWKTIKDGKYLVDALGIDPGSFQHIHKSDSKDIAHAFAMNRLLWSATIGYYLQQFFQPLISPANIEKTRDYFLNHVLASGMIPAFRVNRQPYGILAVTNFDNWQFHDDEDIYFKNLWEKVLQPFDAFWGTLASKIKNISDPSLNLEHGQFSEEFVRILGLTAGSQNFYQRPLVGNHVIENAVGANFKKKPKKGSGVWGIDPEPLAPDNPDKYVDYTMRKAAYKAYKRGDIIKYLKELNFGIPYELPVFNSFLSYRDRIFQMHFAEIYRKFPNKLVDKFKPSPNRKLHTLDIEGNKWNYLEWLENSSYQELIDQHFPKGTKEEDQPDSLLYLLARQAIARNYIDLAAQLMPDSKEHEVWEQGGQIKNRRSFDQRKDISTIDFELEHLFDRSFFNIYEGEMVAKFGAEVKHFLENTGKAPNQIHPFYYTYDKNKWNYLQETTYETADKTIGAFIDEKVKKNSRAKAYQPLVEAKKALDALQGLSTTELQRLFSGHLDLCSYRLDAWQLGLVNRRLKKLRAEENGNPTGIYLGAFGYLENLSPNNLKTVYRVVEDPEFEEATNQFNSNRLVLPVIHFQSFINNEVDIDELLSKAYIYLGKHASGSFERARSNPETIVHQPLPDPANHGFIHTPSQDHAIAAAILRAGFLANNPSKAYDEFAINLSSERVRKALYYIEGLRNGQELAALLGYQFERDLHDAPVPYLDAYLLEFRTRFPLNRDLENHSNNDTTETQKAFNVVNGLDLLNKYREGNENIDLLLRTTGIELDNNPLAKENVKRALDHLNNSLDALSDLLVSESIFQTAKGDLDRSGSILKMLNNDKEIEIPEITQTPKAGKPLSHLVGVQFNLKGTEKIWAGVDSPRSLLNPGLNRWLFEQMPNPWKMCFNIDVGGELKKLSIRNLLIQPIDLLAFFQEKDPFSETSALTYWIKEVAIKFFKPTLDTPIRVLYYDKRNMGSTQKTLGELKPLFENLLKIVNNSRPLFPSDLQLSSRTRPLEKEFYENIDNTDFLEIFNTIVNGQYKHSLYKNYTYIKSYTTYYKRAKLEGFPDNNQQTNYTRLLQLLHEFYYFNQLKEDYNLPFAYAEENLDLIIEKGERAYEYYNAIAQKLKDYFEEVKSMEDKKKQWEGIVELGRMIFGNTLKLFPKFRMNNPDEFKAAKSFPDLMADLNEQVPIEWLQGVALVRENIRAYKKLEIFRTLFAVKAKSEKLEILQLPYQTDHANYRWLGADFSPRIKIQGEQLSLALEFPTRYKTTDLQSGMIIDSWTERIQEEASETAFALHYNQPNAEPPQSCLLCITPEITGNWHWEDIVGCVLSAMDLAKKRAVEPEHFEEDIKARPDGVHYMTGHPMKFVLPALSIPVSNTSETPAVGFDEKNNHF